ncbi:MAG: hypothetical protein Kow0059_06630 [Candidatus Sumerlaeia bacterium]
MDARYKTITLFGAFFARQFDLSHVDAVIGAVRGRFEEFDAPPIQPALPPNAPPDAPRLLMLSQNKRYALELAPNKVGYRLTPSQPDEFGSVFGEFETRMHQLHAFLAENFNLKVIRLGLVAHLFAHLGVSANQKLLDHFIRDERTLGHPLHELQLHALTKPMLPGDVPVNRWVRIKPLRTSDARQLDTGLSIEVDINTLPEYSQDRHARDVRAFFLGAAQHIEERIPFLNSPVFFE